jgi:UDP-3-O-[3-hydroxymyristoyl] glucosamine N-acyltransferase
MPSLSEIAHLVNGRLWGDPHLLISGAATLRDARRGDLTFINQVGLIPRLDQSSASAAIIPEGVDYGRIPTIAVVDPEQAFARVVETLRPIVHRLPHGVSSSAHVSPAARIDPTATIYPGAVIYDDVEIGPRVTIHANACLMEGCRIGADTTIFPGAVLYENCQIGERCLIHAGAVIGAYGFGYKLVDGRHQLSVQLGNVEIEDDVEIGANTTIDRGTYGPTRIGRGTKLDNLVMIGHNCRIGPNNLLCSQVGIAGSCSTGEYVVMAGQVGIGDHLDIGHHVTIAAQSGVMHDIEPGRRILGSPATDSRRQLQIMACLPKLPELRRRIGQLEQAVGEIVGGEPSQSIKRAA